jgi:hypothetical protein
MIDTGTPILRSFDTLEAAAAAVNALVSAGFAHGAIELRALEDEAGPPEGNFIIGNGRTAHGGAPDAIRVGLDVPYEENFKQPVRRSGHLLMVDARGDEQRRRAELLLDQAGGRAVQDVADAAMKH